jgi:hypothetical protein
MVVGTGEAVFLVMHFESIEQEIQMPLRHNSWRESHKKRHTVAVTHVCKAGRLKNNQFQASHGLGTCPGLRHSLVPTSAIARSHVSEPSRNKLGPIEKS